MASRSDRAGAGVDWQSRYLAGDTPWDKGAPHPALSVLLKTHPFAGRVLVPGCGSGHDVRAIAAAGAVEVVGMDIAPAALEAAHCFPASGRESYVLGDFLAGDASRLGPFGAIFEHTCFCAIPPVRRPDYVVAAAAALGEGGVFTGVFFLDPDNPDPDSPPFGADSRELLEEFQPFFDLVETQTRFATFSGRENREAILVFRRRGLEGDSTGLAL